MIEKKKKKKIRSIHYLHFSFEKYVPSQVFKGFSVENLETTPTNFLSKLFLEVYLSPVFNYWGSIFTLYLMCEERSSCFVLYAYFFLSFFLLFFSWQTLMIHRKAEMEEKIILFLAILFHPLTNINFVYRDFYHFF